MSSELFEKTSYLKFLLIFRDLLLGRTRRPSPDHLAFCKDAAICC